MTPDAAVPDWIALLVLLPLAAAVGAFVWPRAAAATGLVGTAAALAAALGLALQVAGDGPVGLAPGGWAAPLGVALYADGLSSLLIVMTAAIGLAIGVAAAAAFGLADRAADSAADRRRRRAFWPLWLLLLTGLNGLYLSADAFNLYITLEIVGLSAVGLTALSGTRTALRAALGYLFAGLVGSLLVLLGVALLYAAHGRVDLAGLGAATGDGPVAAAALAAMLVGLALKTALFPLHFWLPAAHANALAPASALLSALVVKASLYVALRLWLTVFEPGAGLSLLLGGLGAGAMLWGGLQALRAERLKLLVAYSTVAQIGLIALAFALSGTPGAGAAWQGAVYLMLAHAAAKAAMFLAAGRIAAVAGHDVVARLDRAPVRPGAAQFAFALAAVSLIGLPPSGGFLGKWLLLEGAVAADAWPWAAAIALGTLLSAAYMTRVIASFLRADRLRTTASAAWTAGDLVPLALAAGALVLGLVAAWPLTLLAAGAPFADAGDLP